MERMPFTSLRRTGLPIAEANERATRLFPRLVRGSRLHLWKPGDEIVSGRRLLVGVGDWSLYDLSLLDVLHDFLSKGGVVVDRIDVFESTTLSLADFEAHIPGLGNVVNWPQAGFWEGGILQWKAFGWRAMCSIADLCQMTLDWNREMWRWDVRWNYRRADGSPAVPLRDG